MTDNNVLKLNTPDHPLQEVLREGARKMLATAIEAEVAAFLKQHGSLKTDEGKSAVVRNGYLPERAIQTGLGDIEVKVPKVRDRSGSGIKFNSSLIPPYLKRTRNIEEFLPWLYLRGISTGDFAETLKHLLGPDAPGLSSATIGRLKEEWEQDYRDWSHRDLSEKRYVYIWADGIYSTVRMDDRLCLLVTIGSDETGRKELLALSDGYRESEASWTEVLMDLNQRGLKDALKLAVGDGALGLWKAIAKCWPQTDQQNWQHIRTTNPVESVFAAVRLRTVKTKNCSSRATMLAMAFKLMETAQKKWFRLRGYNLLAGVISGIRFVNGIKQQTGDQKQATA